MNILKKSILLGGCVAALTLGGTHQLMAQRNFDPAQMRQDRLDRMKDTLEFKDEDWKAVEPIVGKVMDAERDVMGMRIGGMFGRGERRGSAGSSGVTGSSSGAAATAASANTTRRNRPSMFGEPSPAMTALQKAIDDKAPAAELKAKLAAVRAETKEKEAKLDAAQEELKGVLSSRQEAIAVANGLLK